MKKWVRSYLLRCPAHCEVTDCPGCLFLCPELPVAQQIDNALHQIGIDYHLWKEGGRRESTIEAQCTPALTYLHLISVSSHYV